MHLRKLRASHAASAEAPATAGVPLWQQHEINSTLRMRDRGATQQGSPLLAIVGLHRTKGIVVQL